MSHPRCGRRGTPHGPHRFRRYWASLGAILWVHCGGEL